LRNGWKDRKKEGKIVSGEDDVGKGRENSEEWIKDAKEYFDKGYRLSTKNVYGHIYIVLKRGNSERSLGRYTEEKWRVLLSLYPKKLPSELPPIGERVSELEKEGLSRQEVARRLYMEGYPTAEIMRAHFPIRGLRSYPELRPVESMKETTKWPGYAEELKELIRKQISLSREFAEACTEAGVQVVFAALKKTNLATDDLRKIFTNKEALTDAVSKAAETALKAIEAYDSDAMRRVEEERDEARAAYAFAVAKLKQLEKALGPALSIEKMIHTYLMSGNVAPNLLMVLMGKWLVLKLEALKVKEELGFHASSGLPSSQPK